MSMKQNRGDYSIRIMGFYCILILAMAFIGLRPSNGAEDNKRFIVKYEHGVDILCESYIVKKDDWIYKIFRQKGGMFNNDFRQFTRIFKRLNPHLQNIERIRPNQRIIIPIKKIKTGTSPNLPPSKSIKPESKTGMESSQLKSEKNQIQKTELPGQLDKTGSKSQIPEQNANSEMLETKSDNTNIVEQSMPIKAGIKSGFEVQAIAWSNIPAERIAVINGRIIHEGDTVDGATVAQIGMDAVFLKMGGKLLRINFKYGK